RSSVYYDFPQGDRQGEESLTQGGLAQWVNHRAAFYGGSRILVGYSLGGRIALHALRDSPDLWQAAVIISAHPGLVLEEDRVVRKKADQEWAKRFMHEDWDLLMKSWNSQPVFKNGSQPLLRHERDFDRKKLAS